MLNGAVVLDLSVTAMMVGEQEALGRDDLCCAAASEDDDGIFQACLVNAVNVFRGQLESHLGHRTDVELFNQRQKPHPFISPGLGGREGDKDNKNC